MKVTRRAIDDYRKAVDGQSDLAKAYVGRALETYFTQNPEASTADGRMFAIDLLKSALPNFTDAAETLAADFFDEIMDGLGIDAESKLYDPIDYDTVEERIHYFAKKLNEGDEKAFRDQVVDATRYFVKRSAYENMIRNCEGNNVRYARVPSGFETCPFCFMLASRGFVYHSEAKAWGAHGYHDSCDCTVVPGAADKDGSPRVHIEGYAPATMSRNWSSCEATIGGREQARAEWLAMPEEDREERIKDHGSASRAFARFEQNRIKNEVATRDWHWLYTGKELPNPKKEPGAQPKKKEEKTEELLRQHGFRVVFRNDQEDKSERTSDTFFITSDNGRLVETKWEIKAPDGSSGKAVKNQLKNVVGTKGKRQQCDRVVISNASEHTMLSFEEMCRQMDELYREKRFVEIKEVLIVSTDGRIRRWKR